MLISVSYRDQLNIPEMIETFRCLQEILQFISFLHQQALGKASYRFLTETTVVMDVLD